MNQKNLLEHFHSPLHYGTLENPHFSLENYNPSCGDTITMQGILENNCIAQLRFSGKGCMLSHIAASLLTQHCTGKSLIFALELTTQDMLKLLHMDLGPLRIKCAVLPLEALQEGIRTYQKANS